MIDEKIVFPVKKKFFLINDNVKIDPKFIKMAKKLSKEIR